MLLVCLLLHGWSVKTAKPLPSDPCNFYFGVGDGRAACDTCVSRLTRSADPRARDMVVQRVIVGGRASLREARSLPANHTGWPFRLMITHSPYRDWVATRIFRTGMWEISEPADMGGALKDAIPMPRNGTLLDVGGNVGFYTLLFASHGWDVVAIEALTLNRLAIETTLCLNPTLVPRITLIAAAVGNPAAGGDEKCVVKSDSGRNVGDGRMTCAPGAQCPPGDDHRVCETVPLARIDALLSQHGVRSVDVVKMDIEGAECQAFAGGQALFERLRVPRIQVELKEPHVAACFAEQARLHGYAVTPPMSVDKNAVMYRLANATSPSR